ncbi:3-hydroxyacyl-CoA dehydrogenase [Aestuariivirga litoralis]|uniref:3-hydroxyacyl-CoA dehydrogenase n=1 Tax=Aestuariivirga litoralis TaxID=2650924 RepID=UPI0018C7BC23|nr:3-hydroxyacyl-CoA dehydrogenase [Aestuariivirga litoralis]MBG1231053.1 3-hydroxyacyl-CoA dehydrogenase [Aestuariivirga litoralis]
MTHSRVAIVGAGFIGRAWSISFARAGSQVAIWDQADGEAEKAITYIASTLDDLAANDLLNGQTPAQILNRLTAQPKLEDTIGGALHIQENTPEVLETKIKVFAELDALAASNAVIASSTSALLPSSFTKGLRGRGRCLVVHPINPPYLIPAAEVVPAPWTTEETLSRTRDFLISAGHAPLMMKTEVDGFIMNRLQGALLEEAFRLVADGYASAEDIDIGLRDGLALRWSFMGPFETIDLNAPRGVRDYAARYQGLYANIFPQMQRRVDWTGPVMDQIEAQRRVRLPEAELQQRQLWRDRRLMALVAHKRHAAQAIGD